jgi:hypothetical protein
VAQIIYEGNGSDGGQVPVDSNTYAPGTANVNVAGNNSTQAPQQQKDGNGNPENIVTGDLSRTGAVFLYWNTAADGSKTIYGGGSTFTFPNQTGDLTLYAQWGVTTGLNGGGTTTHYQFYYDPVLAGPGGPEPARTNQVIAACETTDFAWLQAQFAGVTITQTLPIPTYVTAVNNKSGSWSASWGPPLTLNPNQGAGSAFVRCLMIAEVSEMLMLSQHKGWGFSEGFGNEESCGEGLSLFLTTQFQIANGLTGIGLVNNGAPDVWLNTSLPTSNPNSTEFYNQPRVMTMDSALTTSTRSWAGPATAPPPVARSSLFIIFITSSASRSRQSSPPRPAWTPAAIPSVGRACAGSTGT